MKPLAISTGDPAGIGPEVCIQAAKRLLEEDPEVQLLLFGDPGLFPPDLLAHARVQLQAIHTPTPAKPGQPDPANGPYVAQLIAEAVAAVQRGDAQALATAPIAKDVLYASGFQYPGHTEYLGHLAGGVPTHMMLASKALRVVPITLHQSLKSAIEELSEEKIAAAAWAAHRALKDIFGITHPRLALCGLNPHAGENGTMGREDEEIARPAVQKLQDEGLNIRGPLPADTLFHAAARQRYDCVLGMYHDQVLIPIKALAFDSAVNLTLGLPFVRTSPDHGTAFDIAGHGKADASSMLSALRLALQLSA